MTEITTEPLENLKAQLKTAAEGRINIREVAYHSDNYNQCEVQISHIKRICIFAVKIFIIYKNTTIDTK